MRFTSRALRTVMLKKLWAWTVSTWKYSVPAIVLALIVTPDATRTPIVGILQWLWTQLQVTISLPIWALVISTVAVGSAAVWLGFRWGKPHTTIAAAPLREDGLPVWDLYRMNDKLKTQIRRDANFFPISLRSETDSIFRNLKEHGFTVPEVNEIAPDEEVGAMVRAAVFLSTIYPYCKNGQLNDAREAASRLAAKGWSGNLNLRD